MVSTIEYALMAGRAYQTTRDPINQFPILPVTQGWIEIAHVPNNPSFPQFTGTDGFEAVAFQRGNEIVISYAGTNPNDGILPPGPDNSANIGLATGVGSAQLVQAAEYYLQVRAQVLATNPNATFTFTGHSLGGGLAALMGVFFGKQAVTFDQAPFANSAELNLLTPNVAANLKTSLLANGHTEDDLAGLTAFLQIRAALPIGEIPNTSLVTSINVQGEFLSGVPWNLPDRIGQPSYIPTNAPGVLGGDLHSVALLTAFLQSIQTAQSGQTLNGVTAKLTDLMGMIFDSNLYKFSTGTDNTTNRNFLERLVQNEQSNAMVTRFTNDLWKLAQDGGLTMADGPTPATNLVSKALIAFAMQMYYENTANATTATKELFTNLATETTGSGGIRFDRADVAATLTDAKGYNDFHFYLVNNFSAADRQRIEDLLPVLRDWYVQAGASGMNATDTQNRGAFMLGGRSADSLTGGAGNDLLVGNTGFDSLTGGGGTDTLLGGAGFDRYYYTTGDGNDRIEDSDASGVIFVNGQMLVGGVKKAGHTDWTSPDGTITYRMSGTDLGYKRYREFCIELRLSTRRICASRLRGRWRRGVDESLGSSLGHHGCVRDGRHLSVEERVSRTIPGPLRRHGDRWFSVHPPRSASYNPSALSGRVHPADSGSRLGAKECLAAHSRPFRLTHRSYWEHNAFGCSCAVVSLSVLHPC